MISTARNAPGWEVHLKRRRLTSIRHNDKRGRNIATVNTRIMRRAIDPCPYGIYILILQFIIIMFQFIKEEHLFYSWQNFVNRS